MQEILLLATLILACVYGARLLEGVSLPAMKFDVPSLLPRDHSHSLRQDSSETGKG